MSTIEFIIELEYRLANMLKILIMNKNNESKCAIRDITNMLDVLNEMKGEHDLEIKDVKTIISKQYNRMFIAKAGLSEFYVNDEDENERIQKTKHYYEIKSKVEELLA